MTGSASQRISWKRLIKLAVWYALDSMVCLIPVRPRPGRVIVLRLDKIGDFLIWLDAAQSLVRHYRELGNRVTLVADSTWAKWADQLGVFDGVIAVDTARFEEHLGYRFSIGRAVRETGAETAVLPVYSRSFGAGDALTRVSGAPERVGSEGDPENTSGFEHRVGNGWFTRLIPARAGQVMELERDAEFMSGLLARPFPARIVDLRALLPDKPVPAILPEIVADQPYYVLFPGASAAGRCWPAVRFSEIATLIHEKTGWTGVVCGGPGDTALAARIAKSTSAPLVSAAGRTSLMELATVIAGAKVIVTNETSASHIAAAVQVPAVCVAGGGHYGRFLPYPAQASDGTLPIVVSHPMPCFGCNWNCIFEVPADEPKPCVANIEIDDVWERVLPVLEA